MPHIYRWVYLGEILPPSCLSQIHRIGKRHELVLELYAFILLAPHYRRVRIQLSLIENTAYYVAASDSYVFLRDAGLRSVSAFQVKTDAR